MASLTAIKLEPKIENEDSFSNCSMESDDVVELENHPSCSTSVNVSMASSSSQIYNYGSDSDDSTGGVVDVIDSQQSERVVEVVAIDSDTSEEEEEANTVQTPRKAGLRQLTKRRSFKVISQSIIIYSLVIRKK